MDATRQAIRWGIPGWLFILTLFIFNFLYHYIGGWIVNPNEDYSIFKTLTTTFEMGPGYAILIGFLGVPIGYIIYQIYFAYTRTISIDSQYYYIDLIKTKMLDSAEVKNFIKYWQSKRNAYRDPKLKIGRSVKLFKRILIYSLKVLYFLTFFTTPKKIDSILDEKERNEIKWAYIDLFIRMGQFNSEGLYKREQYLSDLFHSLGTTRLSILLAFTVHICIIIKDLIFQSYICKFPEKLYITLPITIIIPLMLVFLSSYICELNRNNILIHKFVILKALVKNKQKDKLD